MKLPLAPAHEKRRGVFVRALQTLGLGATSIVLFLVAMGAYFASEWLVATPTQLYHRAWQAAPIFIYDPAELKDWDQWKHKFDAQIKTDEDAVKYANEMLDSIKDPFTRLHSSAEVQAMKQSATGEFAGIGIGLGYKTDADGKPVLDSNNEGFPTTNADGYPLVDKVFDGGPAHNAGLKAGDALISANGVSLKDKTLSDIVKELKGKPGTEVKLIVSDNGVERTVDIVRGMVKVPNVTHKMIGDVGYIRLDNFEQNATLTEMRDALAKLQGAKSLVIDLRGNPGGRVDFCITLASMFLDKGDVVSTRNRVPFGSYSTTTYRLDANNMTVEELDEATGEKTVRVSKRQPNLVGDKPIVILINGHSASASEMFTGALKDNGRAVVVGEKTFGKGIGQMMLPMPNGTLLRITTLRYFTPNGTWLGNGGSVQTGITPDHIVTPGKAFRPQTGTDNQLNFALELIK